MNKQVETEKILKMAEIEKRFPCLCIDNSDHLMNRILNFQISKSVGCASATPAGILNCYRIVSSDILLKVFTFFAGGVGKRAICGALLGALGALGALNVALAENKYGAEVLKGQSANLKRKIKICVGTLECKHILREFTKDDGSIDIHNPLKSKKCNMTLICSMKEV